MRTRLARCFVSLAVAYSLLGALFLGSVAAGRVAASPMPLCGAASTGDHGSAPLPVSRDLACLVSGCCGCCPVSGIAPLAASAGVLREAARIAWQDSFRSSSAAIRHSGAAARAPPAFS